MRQEDLIRTKVGKWSDRSESIILGCTGILILLVYISSKRVADSELNEAVSWYWQGDTTLGLGRSSESVCTNSAMGLQVI